MHHDIGAQRERTREQGRRASGIDAEDRARVMRELGGGGDVANTPERIARRLQPDEFGAPRQDRRGELQQILGLDEIDAEAVQRRLGASQLRRAQYITRGATICEPCGKLRNSVIAADMPEPNANVDAAPSSAPMIASASRTVRLSGRP